MSIWGENWVPYQGSGGGGAQGGDTPPAGPGPSEPIKGPTGRPNVPYAEGLKVGTEFAQRKQKPVDPDKPITGPTSQWQSGGLGRYVNRNANGLQFNKGAMRQTPSHMNDWIRARHNMNLIGRNPGAEHAEEEYEHW